MIDTQLVQKAVPISQDIMSVDKSWRRHIRCLQSTSFELPFDGKYNAVIRNSTVMIEGYSGELVIDKLVDGANTYLLTNPIHHSPFKMYGVWDKKAHFSHFASEPTLGFHYLGLSVGGTYSICTGDIEYANPNNIDSLMDICARIMTSFKVIYIGSLGSIHIPDEHARLEEILTNSQTSKISALLSERLIKKLL